jgi:hypothetical protein
MANFSAHAFSGIVNGIRSLFSCLARTGSKNKYQQHSNYEHHNKRNNYPHCMAHSFVVFLKMHDITSRTGEYLCCWWNWCGTCPPVCSPVWACRIYLLATFTKRCANLHIQTTPRISNAFVALSPAFSQASAGNGYQDKRYDKHHNKRDNYPCRMSHSFILLFNIHVNHMLSRQFYAALYKCYPLSFKVNVENNEQ